MVKKDTGISLSEFYNEVARRADTEGLKINVAETKRVIARFDVLGNCSVSNASTSFPNLRQRRSFLLRPTVPSLTLGDRDSPGSACARRGHSAAVAISSVG